MLVGDLVRLTVYGQTTKGKHIPGQLGIIISFHPENSTLKYRVRWFDTNENQEHRTFDVFMFTPTEIEKVM